MRSRPVKKSPSDLPRTNQHLALEPGSRLHRFGLLPMAKAFFVTIFASLGLSLIIYLGHLRFWCSRNSTAANSVLSRFRFTSKPPLVDRAILEKIAGLDLENKTNSESGTSFSIPISINSSYVFSPFFRLPRVTCIPEAQPQAPPNPGMEMQNQFRSEGNADHVPRSYRFLFPLKIAEQGLNAHVHLAQLLELARALNRTLVLPNVGKNTVGACRRWRFGVYYDEQALLSKSDCEDSNCVIQQDRFKAWVNSLGSSPSSQLVSVDWTNPKGFPPLDRQSSDNLGFYIHHNPETAAVLHSFAGCLNKKIPRLDLTGPFPPLSFVVADNGKQDSNGGNILRKLVEKLSRPTFARVQSGPLGTTGNYSTNYNFDRAQTSPDVLILSWNMPLSAFQPHPTTNVHYSPQLRALAARLVKHLSSYIAATWEAGNSKGNVTLGCVEALRSTLHYVLSSHEQLGIRNIWLVGNLRPSVFLPLRTSTLIEESFFVSDVKLTGVRQELERMVREGEEVDDVASNGDEVVRKQEVLKDAGVFGILDKLVSMKSTVFVTASESCGETSLFTRDVLDWRGENVTFFSSPRLGQGMMGFLEDRTE